MQHYELMFVLPGTLSEEEVAIEAATVKALIEAEGATDVAHHDLGKTRLAYPMKHIRYGYYHICRFAAEPSAVPTMKSKLRLNGKLLRAIITKVAAESKMEMDKLIALSDVTVREIGQNKPRAEKKTENAEESAVMETKKVSKPKKEEKTAEPKETRAEDVKIKDIDKKLDQLLETDTLSM